MFPPMPDPVIIGAGIQGATLALAAVARGMRPLVIDQGAEPSGASVNSYGIVHGGLRYLQRLDIARWSESRRAQRWYIDRYPRHVQPLRCVMPLYRNRLRSPALFGIARTMDRTLRMMMQRQVPLPSDHGCGREEILASYPVPSAGLVGGAVWHDARVDNIPALLRAILAEVEDRGGVVLRSTEAVALDIERGRVRGLHVRDRAAESERRIAGTDIFDCGGAWAGQWLPGAIKQALPSAAVLAFNLLIDLPSPVGGDAFALSPDAGRGRSYFFRRHAGATLVGTFYRPAPVGAARQPTEQDILSAMRQVRLCLPGMAVERDSVRSVHAGLLPDRDGSGRALLSADRHLRPGPEGYHILLGGKLTTAPLLSERVAARMWRPASRHVRTGWSPRHA